MLPTLASINSCVTASAAVSYTLKRPSFFFFLPQAGTVKQLRLETELLKRGISNYQLPQL